MRKSIAAIAALMVVALLLATGGQAAPAGKDADSAAGDHDHVGDSPAKGFARKLAPHLAAARIATAKYANDLEAAKADGYSMTITPMIPDMGHHFLNPDITEFDVTRPPILVYVRDGDEWQLVAFEWVFAEKPDKKPLPGAVYGSFGAACHYEDGNFIFEEDESNCPDTHPETGGPFTFWHPDLVTLHLWAWYHNPAGIYNATNRLIRPFNES